MHLEKKMTLFLYTRLGCDLLHFTQHDIPDKLSCWEADGYITGKNASADVKLTVHSMTNVLHCNRFQMVLETESDSEHQKKSVNLDLRTTSLAVGKSLWGRWGAAFVFPCDTCEPDVGPSKKVHLPPQEHWFQMVLDRWQYSKPPPETSFQGGHLRKSSWEDRINITKTKKTFTID